MSASCQSVKGENLSEGGFGEGDSCGKYPLGVSWFELWGGANETHHPDSRCITKSPNPSMSLTSATLRMLQILRKRHFRTYSSFTWVSLSSRPYIKLARTVVLKSTGSCPTKPILSHIDAFKGANKPPTESSGTGRSALKTTKNQHFLGHFWNLGPWDFLKCPQFGVRNAVEHWSWSALELELCKMYCILTEHVKAPPNTCWIGHPQKIEAQKLKFWGKHSFWKYSGIYYSISILGRSCWDYVHVASITTVDDWNPKQQPPFGCMIA